jgi:hypothetical protein
VDPDPDQEGKIDPKIKEKSYNFPCFEVLDVIFSGAGGFSYSLKAFHGGLGMKILFLL